MRMPASVSYVVYFETAFSFTRAWSRSKSEEPADRSLGSPVVVYFEAVATTCVITVIRGIGRAGRTPVVARGGHAGPVGR